MSSSKPDIAQGRPSFASRTAFELLAPDDEEGEEEEEEEEEVPEVQPTSVGTKPCATSIILYIAHC